MVAFVDPSEYADNPGWPLRNFPILVRKRWGWKGVRIPCYRDSHAYRYEPRILILDLKLEEDCNIAQVQQPRRGSVTSPPGSAHAQANQPM
jgi:hypothetical protein